MPYRIAGIDVHKKMLAVVCADVEEMRNQYQFERKRFASNPEQLRMLAQWLIEQEVVEVVMESTAQYWKPVWGALERYWKPFCQTQTGTRPKAGALHLAQAQSNRGPRGRKRDFPDAERLVKRLVADELKLSFVPEVEQRLWRTVIRTKHQLTCNRVQLQNRLEAFLEDAQIKLSSLVSDLLGVSARRILRALADGETDPVVLSALADAKLRATPAQLCDALGACADLAPVRRRLLAMILQELELLDRHIHKLNQEMAALLEAQQDAVKRLAEVPGLGVDSAQQIVAEIGPKAATFASAKQLSSWAGLCPGNQESAGVSKSHRSPKGNRSFAAHSQSVCQRRSQGQRYYFRNHLSASAIAPWTQTNYRSHCSSLMPAHLDHSASGRGLCRARPFRQRTITTATHQKNASRTAQARLSDRTGIDSSMNPLG
jgi:transposase